MKKCLTLLIVLALLLTMIPAVFAATSGQLHDGDNAIELPWDTDDASVYTYTATQTGTLYIVATEFSYALKDYDYSDNSGRMDEWSMYTLLTIDGAALSDGYFGSIEVVEGQTYTFSWKHRYATEKWYAYGWAATLNLSYTDEWMPQAGTAELPAVLRIEQCPTDSVEIAAGGIAYYTLYGFEGACLTVIGENAYITATVFNLETALHEDVYYEAVDGVVTMPINSSYVNILIGNDGPEDAIFELDYYYLLGSEKNPAQLVIGENTAVTVADNYDGYNFTWTAEKSGTLTLTFPEKGWMCTIDCRKAGVNNEFYVYTDVNAPIVLKVTEGEVWSINVNSFLATTYIVPGGDVTFTADFVLSPMYSCNHNYAVTEERAGTCASKSFTTYTCPLCGHAYTEEGQMDPTNHSAISLCVAGFDAACEAEGFLSTWYCEGCEGLYADEAGTIAVTYEDQVIPATGHSFGPWERSDDGQAETRSCDTCGFQESRAWICPHAETTLTGKLEATCTEDGYTGDMVCQECGVVITEGTKISALGHSFGQWVRSDDGKTETRICETCGFQESREWVCPHIETTLTGKLEATCTEEGYTGDMVCQECGAVVTEGTVAPALGHSFGDWNPSDYSDRIEVRTCAVCGFQESRDLDCVHTHTMLSGTKAATCTENGYTGDVMCSDCYVVITEGEVIPAVGHNHVLSQTTAGTCVTKSTTTYTCTACDDSYIEEGALDKANHAALEQTAVGKKATCTEAGVKDTWTCQDCQSVFADAQATIPTTYEAQVIPAEGHSLGEWYVSVEPTCTGKGQSRRVCANCRYYETREIAAADHSYTSAETAPTCTEVGYTTHTCAACGHSYRDQEVAALGHREVTDQPTQPTCTQSGLSEGKHCDRCQAVLVAQDVIPANGHQDENLDYLCDVCGSNLCVEHQEETLDAVAPTCETSGLTEGKQCGRCGELLLAQEVIPALDHDWAEATCESAKTCHACGKTEGQALSHSFGQWAEVKAPTTEEAGLAERTCELCGHKEQQVLEKLDPPATEPTEPPTESTPTQPKPTEPTAPETKPTDAAPTTPANTTGTQPDTQTPAENNGALTAVIVVVVVICAAAVLVILLKKKK